MTKLFIKHKTISKKNKVFIIAEIGSNHNDNLKTAKQLIQTAKKCGADAIKINRSKISIHWLKQLKNLTETRYGKKGFNPVFICSVFSESMVDELEKIDVACYKIASSELNHIPLIERIAQTKKPIIISTGLSKMSEVYEAVEIIEKYHKKAGILHCISAYPVPENECNLNIIKSLKFNFNYNIGFSDHTETIALPALVAIYNGATIIEKHITLDRKQAGLDHKFALIPREFEEMVQLIRHFESLSKMRQYAHLISSYGKDRVHNLMGQFEKVIQPCESILYPKDKRSIITPKGLSRGEILTDKNTAILKSERNLLPGAHPRYYKLMIGKTANKQIPAGQGVNIEDVQ